MVGSFCCESYFFPIKTIKKIPTTHVTWLVVPFTCGCKQRKGEN